MSGGDVVPYVRYRLVAYYEREGAKTHQLSIERGGVVTDVEINAEGLARSHSHTLQELMERPDNSVDLWIRDGHVWALKLP